MVWSAMSRRLGTVLYFLLLAALAVAWVRSAWMVPLRNYPFDFSINYTGARLISAFGPDRPLYDRPTLAAEAAPYTYWTDLYTKLYLTYIQTSSTTCCSSRRRGSWSTRCDRRACSCWRCS
jgi:hypothetical protein